MQETKEQQEISENFQTFAPYFTTHEMYTKGNYIIQFRIYFAMDRYVF